LHAPWPWRPPPWPRYPEKPIRYNRAVGPGGGADSLARILAGGASPSNLANRSWWQPPGASGGIGMEMLVRANPDVHHRLWQHACLAINRSCCPVGRMKRAPILQPVARLTKLAKPAHGHACRCRSKSVRALIDYGKNNRTS